MEEATNPYSTPQASVVHSAPKRELATNSPYGPMRDTRVLGRVVRGLLWLQAVMILAFGGISFYVGLQSSREVDVFYENDGFTQTPLNLVYVTVAVVILIAFIATAILFGVWTNKSMKNAWALRESSLLPKMTPGWAVGFYFVPILMLWKPFQGMKEIWQVTFRGAQDSKLLGWWWGFWLFGNLADNIGVRIPTDTFPALSVSCFYDAASSVLSIVGAILLARIVCLVTNEQGKYL